MKYTLPFEDNLAVFNEVIKEVNFNYNFDLLSSKKLTNSDDGIITTKKTSKLFRNYMNYDYVIVINEVLFDELSDDEKRKLFTKEIFKLIR